MISDLQLMAVRLARQVGRPCVVLTDGADVVTTEQIDAWGRWWSERRDESGAALFAGYWVLADSHGAWQAAA